MARLPTVLICDDDQTFHLAVKYALKGLAECRSAYHCDEALSLLKKVSFDVLFLDIQIRTPDEGLDFLPRIRALDPEVAIVMSSGRKDFETVKKAVQLGADDYLPKDFDPTELGLVIDRVLDHKSLEKRRAQQNYEAQAAQNRNVLIGASPAITQLKKTLEKIRNSPANVVITGETGTGKEVVARLLRRTLEDGSLAPFVAVDSSTIQSTMAESVLFGHEKGAFTGAQSASKGVFEQANGGTVYFDEIGNMPVEIQAKLLRVLQEKEVMRLGSDRVIPLEFRVISATNKDLKKLCNEGRFLFDLLQRLEVIPIELPPLRDRMEDIPLLIEHFMQTHGGGFRFTPDAVSLLQKHSWPGNIRQLSNLVLYILTMADGPDVDVADLPPQYRDAPAQELSEKAGFYGQMEGFEKGLLERAYQEHGGNVSQMALALQMDRSHLHSKLKHHGLHQPQSKKTQKT